MKKTGRGILFWGFLLIFLSLGFNLIKQIAGQIKAGRQLAVKQVELNKIKEENKQLRAKLEEIDSPKFLEERAATVLGMSKGGKPVVIKENETKVENIPDQVLEPPLPNYKRWLKLFIY